MVAHTSQLLPTQLNSSSLPLKTLGLGLKCRECQASRGRGCSASKRPSWGKETRTRDDTFTKMAKREGPSTSSPRATKKAAKGGSKVKIEHDEREVDPQGLDKLPQDVWRRILDNLDENDLFPLALSCRSFRQKQKELLARKRREQRVRFVSSWELSALKTNLRQKLEKGQPTSVEYLWFCNKEIAWTDANARGKRRQPHNMKKYLSQLAGFHGQLPLLQELVKAATKLVALVSMAAGESSSSQSLHLLHCFGV